MLTYGLGHLPRQSRRPESSGTEYTQIPNTSSNASPVSFSMLYRQHWSLQLCLQYTGLSHSLNHHCNEPRQHQQPCYNSSPDEHLYQHSQHHVSHQPAAPGYHHRPCEHRPSGGHHHAYAHAHEHRLPAQHCHEIYGHYALPVPNLAIFSLVEPGALTSIFALTAVLLTSEWREQTHRVATLQH